jgi:hypothetical protein
MADYHVGVMTQSVDISFQVNRLRKVRFESLKVLEE